MDVTKLVFGRPLPRATRGTLLVFLFGGGVDGFEHLHGLLEIALVGVEHGDKRVLRDRGGVGGGRTSPHHGARGHQAPGAGENRKRRRPLYG